MTDRDFTGLSTLETKLVGFIPDDHSISRTDLAAAAGVDKGVAAHALANIVKKKPDLLQHKPLIGDARQAMVYWGDAEFDEGPSFTGPVQAVYDAIPDEGIGRVQLQRKSKIGGGNFPKAIKALEEHGLITAGQEGEKGKAYTVRKTGSEPTAPAKNIISKSLMLGEVAWATKVAAPKAMTGLAYWLGETGRTDIDQVLIVGGAVPRIPAFYSVSGSEDMRFLGNDAEAGPTPELEEILSNPSLNDRDREYFKENLTGKVITYNDALELLVREVAKLDGVLPGAEWHIQHGEEDVKNMRQAKELMITEAARKKLDKAKYLEDKEKLEDEKIALGRRAETATRENEVFGYVHKRLSRVKRTGQKLQEYLVGLANDTIEHFDMGKTEASQIKDFLADGRNTKTKVGKKHKSLEEEVRGLRQQATENSGRLQDIDSRLDAVSRQMEAWGFFSVTKRVEVRPDEEELFFRLAKTEYNERIYDAIAAALPGLRGRFHVHTTARKYIDGAREEMIAIGDEFRIGLIHNPNHLSSNTPTKLDLARMVEEGKRIAQLEEYLGNEVPDMLVSAHGKGGFRFIPQLKYREEFVNGLWRVVPETVLAVKLPTFQSIPALEHLHSRNLKNENTKRYAAGDFASGAVIHTQYDDGSFDVEYIDGLTLEGFAEVKDQIAQKEGELGGLKGKKATRARGEIEALKAKLDFPTQQIELDGDSHLGAANWPGRPSNYDFVDAIQNYQRAHGLPEILVISEALHASIPRVVDGNQQFWGLVPSRVEAKAKEIRESGKPMKDQIELLEQLLRTQTAATPITHSSKIVEEWAERCLPYAKDVLAAGGTVAIASGNHWNKSGPGRDEATDLAIPLRALGYDREQVKALHGLGEGQGMGEIILPGSGKRAYIAHRLRAGKDKLLPAFAQIRGAGIRADVVLCFDRHHTMGGFAEGTVYALSPAEQTWNHYVDEIGSMASPRGLMNLHLGYDANPGESGDKVKFAKWEMVLDPTLEGHWMPWLRKDLSFK